MINILWVGLGGSLGAISRYLISMYEPKIFISKIPIGTLTVNILGGILIGIIMGLSLKTNIISKQLKLFLVTGLLGGLTTFSTFSYESVNLIQSGKIMLGLENIFLNVILSLAGVMIGASILS